MIDKYLKDKTYVIVTHRTKLKELCNKHYVFENHIIKEIVNVWFSKMLNTWFFKKKWYNVYRWWFIMGNWLDDLKSDKKQPTKRTEQSWLDRF